MREALALSSLIWKIVHNSLGTPELLGHTSSFQEELGDLLCKFGLHVFRLTNSSVPFGVSN